MNLDLGDQLTVNGQTRTIADVNWNYRPACRCGDGCPRIQFAEGGYARTCDIPTQAVMVADIIDNIRAAA